MKTALFETIIGSHIWQMNHDKSDIDLFRCYQLSSKEILLGETPKNTFDQSVKGLDIQESEISTVINELKHNNLNYLLAVHSPIVLFDNFNILKRLKAISSSCLSKEAYNSIHGLALSNYKKYIESGIDTSESRCNKVARTLLFGMTLLDKGRIEFKPSYGNTPETVKALISELDNAKEDSNLSEKCSPEQAQKFEQLLEELRILDLNQNKV